MSSPSPAFEEIMAMSPQEAIYMLNDIIAKNPVNDEAYFLRGKKHWALNQYRLAINDFIKAVEINPKSQASLMIDYSNSVLDYYNQDLLNP